MSTKSHAPWCDSVLGPDFEVGDGEVRMTLFACWAFECWQINPADLIAEATR